MVFSAFPEHFGCCPHRHPPSALISRASAAHRRILRPKAAYCAYGAKILRLASGSLRMTFFSIVVQTTFFLPIDTTQNHPAEAGWLNVPAKLKYPPKGNFPHSFSLSLLLLFSSASRPFLFIFIANNMDSTVESSSAAKEQTHHNKDSSRQQA